MRVILRTAALPALSGCSPSTIHSDDDTTTDVGRFRTWTWFTGPHP